MADHIVKLSPEEEAIALRLEVLALRDEVEGLRALASRCQGDLESTRGELAHLREAYSRSTASERLLAAQLEQANGAVADVIWVREGLLQHGESILAKLEAPDESDARALLKAYLEKLSGGV